MINSEQHCGIYHILPCSAAIVEFRKWFSQFGSYVEWGTISGYRVIDFRPGKRSFPPLADSPLLLPLTLFPRLPRLSTPGFSTVLQVSPPECYIRPPTKPPPFSLDVLRTVPNFQGLKATPSSFRELFRTWFYTSLMQYLKRWKLSDFQIKHPIGNSRISGPRYKSFSEIKLQFWACERNTVEIFFLENFISLKISWDHFLPTINRDWDIDR